MIIFWFKEAFRIFGRAKSSSILSFISLSISIILITASFYTIYLTYEFERNIKKKFILNVFLDDSLSRKNIIELQNELEKSDFTSYIKLIDKEEAAETFIRETGEDFHKILDYNPLPASFSLKLKSEYVHEESIKNIRDQLAAIPGIDEILFEHETLEKLVNTLRSLQNYLFLITSVIILISVYITYSTIKLIISLKSEELETMKLIGAKLSTIKMPIILNEVITGLLASVFSFIIIKYLFLILFKSSSFSEYFTLPDEFLVIIILIGPVISLLISILVLMKITLKI